MYYLNQKIENLVRIFDQNERKSYLRLDLNENPGGLPEEFVNGVLGDVTPQLIAQYPETLHFTEVLAQYLGTDIQHSLHYSGIYIRKRKNCWRGSFIFYVSGLFRDVW